MRGLLFVVASVALVSSSTIAQTPRSYFCEVTNVYELSDAGALQSVSGSEGKKGDHFQIDIKTGEMSGTSLSSIYWANTSVLDFGTSPRGSFLKVMYSSPPGSEFMNVAYLEVQGTIKQPSRPFLFKEGRSLYSGVCRTAF
jgi:hypothetical protein